MSQTYSVIPDTLFISFIMCDTCLLCLGAVPWVGGVDVYTVGSPLFVCACIVGTPVCVPFMLDA